jgi:hypothetical protein
MTTVSPKMTTRLELVLILLIIVEEYRLNCRKVQNLRKPNAGYSLDTYGRRDERVVQRKTFDLHNEIKEEPEAGHKANDDRSTI